jgi:uncharacterized membrane protein (DUF106 family)
VDTSKLEEFYNSEEYRDSEMEVADRTRNMIILIMVLVAVFFVLRYFNDKAEMEELRKKQAEEKDQIKEARKMKKKKTN